jgi:ribonuclease BN (tRNA processing enzyme)
MILKFLGCGGAFCDSNQYQSNCAIELKDKLFLIDCGSDAKFSLKEQYPYINNGNILDYVKWVYISHIHGDHCHGLEWLGFCTYFSRNEKKPIKLISHPEVMHDLWNGVLKSSMQSIVDKENDFEDYFDINSIGLDIPVKISYGDESFKFNIVKSLHVSPNKYSYGMYIKTQKGSAYFTSDVNSDNWNVNRKYYEKADIIFQDCENYPFKSGVHYHYDDLVKLPKEIKGKMVLYHHDEKIAESKFVQIFHDGFFSFAQKGAKFEI